MIKKPKQKNINLKKKKRKQAIKEKEDSEGVYKCKGDEKFSLDPIIFYIVKGILLLIILWCYFNYSLLLLPLFVIYGSLYYFSFCVQRYINRGYVKEKHAKVFKLDAAFAIISVVASTLISSFSFSRIIGAKGRMIQRFVNMWLSLQTGIRNAFKGSRDFGNMSPPANRPSGGGASGKPSMSLDDLPLEYAFSQILTSIIQMMVFIVLIMGFLSIIVYVYKTYINKKYIKIKQNNPNKWEFSKEELNKLLNEEV